MKKKEFYAFIEKCEFLFNMMVKKELITTGGKAPSVEVGQDNRCYFNSKIIKSTWAMNWWKRCSILKQKKMHLRLFHTF